jgi:hypothetical protein
VPAFVHPALVLVGAAAQAVGFALAVWELTETRRRYLEHVGRPPKVEVIGRFAQGVGQAMGARVVTGGREPTVDQRIAWLERDLAEMENRHQERLNAMRTSIGGEMDDVVRLANRAREREDDALRNLIRGILVADIPLRAVAIALFVLGLVLSTVASFC